MAARVGNLLTQPGEFHVPGARKFRLCPQCSIALLECAGVAHPGIHEWWFHVEHRPVHPAPAAIASFLDELVHARFDHLHGKRLGELSQRVSRPSRNPRSHAGAGDLEAQRLDMTTSTIYPSNDSQVILS